jgi:hypothetical protein
LIRTALGWSGCLRATAAIVFLVEEATRITLGQQLEVLTSHQVNAILETINTYVDVLGNIT